MNNHTYLILDNIRSSLNVGAIFRTADSAGINKIYLCGITGYPSNKEIKQYDNKIIAEPIKISEDGVTAEIKYTPSHLCLQSSLEKKLAKTALKSLNSINWEYHPRTAELIRFLKKQNIKIVSLEQTKNSLDYKKYNYDRPLAIVVGNEINGVSDEVLSLSDDIIEIKLHGASKSLNVATAAGIILFKSIEESNR